MENNRISRILSRSRDKCLILNELELKKRKKKKKRNEPRNIVLMRKNRMENLKRSYRRMNIA